MPNKNKIGEKIKTLMEVRNVSLDELANDSDVNIELVEKILNDDEKYKELNIVVILPFLDKEYCDQLFMRFVLEGKACKHSIVTIVPFVSKTCLSKFVDEYINGKYQDVEMNMLYQFLDSEDVKKVFNYILSKTND